MDWENSIHYFIAALPEVPDDLLLKLQKDDVQLIGISAHPERLRVLKNYKINDVIDLLEKRLNKTDTELASTHNMPTTAVTELAIVYSIMHKLNIYSVNYIRTSSGSSSALLINEDYWHGGNPENHHYR